MFLFDFIFRCGNITKTKVLMGMKIFSFLKNKTQEAPKEVVCVRCGKNISPYKNCCILGYDNRSNSGISSKDIEVICHLCTSHLGFELNAISGTGGVVPTIFWTTEEVNKIRELEARIHLENRTRRERKRQNRRKNKIKRKRRA